MKTVPLMLKPNVELMFEAYCRARGMAPQEVLSELISRLVSENEQFIYDWLRKSDVETEKRTETDELPVHFVFKGKRYDATFSPRRRQVNLNGQWMNPSPAAMAITVYPANGWIFWKFVDGTGREQPIDKFRKSDVENLLTEPGAKTNTSSPLDVEKVKDSPLRIDQESKGEEEKKFSKAIPGKPVRHHFKHHALKNRDEEPPDIGRS